MKQKLRLFAIHQTAISLQRTNNLSPRTNWYLALDESNHMRFAYFTIHPGKNPPPQNGCRLKSEFFFRKAPVLRPPLTQFNRTFHKTNRPPLHYTPVLPGHCTMAPPLPILDTCKEVSKYFHCGPTTFPSLSRSWSQVPCSGPKLLVRLLVELEDENWHRFQARRRHGQRRVFSFVTRRSARKQANMWKKNPHLFFCDAKTCTATPMWFCAPSYYYTPTLHRIKPHSHVHASVHSKLRSIISVATKVHLILRSFVVWTWMHDIIVLV
jgi:hypothetical protein